MLQGERTEAPSTRGRARFSFGRRPAVRVRVSRVCREEARAKVLNLIIISLVFAWRPPGPGERGLAGRQTRTQAYPGRGAHGMRCAPRRRRTAPAAAAHTAIRGRGLSTADPITSDEHTRATLAAQLPCSAGQQAQEAATRQELRSQVRRLDCERAPVSSLPLASRCDCDPAAIQVRDSRAQPRDEP